MTPTDSIVAERILDTIQKARGPNGRAEAVRRLAWELAHMREGILACAMVAAEREFELTARDPLLLPRTLESTLRGHIPSKKKGTAA